MNAFHVSGLASPCGGQWTSHKSTKSVPSAFRLASRVWASRPTFPGGHLVVMNTFSRPRPLSRTAAADPVLVAVRGGGVDVPVADSSAARTPL